MGSLCRLPVAKNHNFAQILTFGDTCTDPLLSMRAKFGMLEQTHCAIYMLLRARVWV